VNQEEATFTCLWEKFPRLSEAKLKECVFIGPQIRDLIKDEYFDTLLQCDEKATWDSFKFVVKGFLGNRRTQNYEELVNNLLQSYQVLGCNMSQKYTSFTRVWIVSRELWCSEWWTWRTFSSTHFFNIWYLFNSSWVYTRWQWYTITTKVTYKNKDQHQQYIEQTIYPPLDGGKSADRAPSLSGIP